MKKVLLAFDASHFSEGAFEFGRRLNELRPLLLTGIFLPQQEPAGAWATYSYGIGGMYNPIMEDSDSAALEKNISRFEKLCIGNSIDYRVHEDINDFILPQVKKESSYADLLILGSELFFDNTANGTPNDYLQALLHNICCPVILVPEKYDFPESIILAYNGTDESVYAIKQFAYLLPELTNTPTILVYVNDNDQNEDFPDKIVMEELVARHYSDLTLFKLQANPGKFFSTWISEKKSALLVSGSFGRSEFSRLFKKSFIKDVIADHRLPIFIAHKG